MNAHRWQVTSRENGLRLVYFLQKRVSASLSARFWKRTVEKSLCKVNGFRERFGSKVLKTGDWVELEASWKSVMKEKEEMDCPILLQDDMLTIVSKPAGIVSEDKNFAPLLLTHRLDKDTSGLLILAKSTQAKDLVIGLFAKREIHKKYLAIVQGSVKNDQGVCKSLLARKRTFQGGAIWGSSHRGLEAVTEWQCLSRSENASLILCQPKTGRTHQIRVHMAELGHPILGDYQYGRKGLGSFWKRQLLHAQQLEFTHPKDQSSIQLEAPLPDDFLEAQESLGL
jgi:23S rRNA-/tRNA-specific pseudouridylate synthase